MKSIPRIIAWKLAKIILHDMYDRVGHHPFQGGYSFTCGDGRICVKAAMLRSDLPRWDFRFRNINADKVVFVAFDRESEVQHVWFIPVDSLIEGKFLVREDEAEAWDDYKIDDQKVYKVVSQL